MANLGDSIPQTPFTPHELSCGGEIKINSVSSMPQMGVC